MMRRSQPGPVGLYDPRFEHDACGVSFVVDIKGRASRRIVDLAIGALCNLEHRGATGAEPDTGDGAGILLQVPDRFLREVAGFALPPAGHYAVGLCFLPTDEVAREKTVAAIEGLVAEEGLQTVGWRDVPVEPDVLGESARQVLPVIPAAVPGRPRGRPSGLALDRRIYPLRKRIEHEVDDEARSPAARRPTSRRCRRGPSSTRACSRPGSSARSTPT